MRLWLERFAFGRDSTLGALHLVEDGADPKRLCFTIEDERRVVKVPGETCIPVGVFRIEYRTEGGMHAHYSERFAGLHRGMLWLRNVPDYEWVYLHLGNRESETAGCPLLVTTPIVTPAGEFVGGSSVDAYRSVYQMVAAALDTGEDVVLSITEREAE
jgi:hypothetical protein